MFISRALVSQFAGSHPDNLFLQVILKIFRMKIFITGASGFIGGAIARKLSTSHTVTAMSRSVESDELIKSLGATPIRCELNQVNKEHLSDTDVIIHCAAMVKQWGTRKEFWDTTVLGTKQLLQAAKEAGVRRLIYLGTEAVLFTGGHMHDLDEGLPYPSKPQYLYPGSKAAAEKIVLEANTKDFTTVSFVWGPGDESILPVIKRAIERGMYMWIDHGRAITTTTHINNVIHGVELALTHGRGGQAYFITDDEQTTVRKFLTALLDTQGINLKGLSIPSFLARTLGLLIETFWKALGLKTEPPLTHFQAAMASSDCTIRIDKARSELGYTPIISVEQGLSQLRLTFSKNNAQE